MFSFYSDLLNLPVIWVYLRKNCLTTTAVPGRRHWFGSVSGKGNGKESGIIGSGVSHPTIAEIVVIYSSLLFYWAYRKGWIRNSFFFLLCWMRTRAGTAMPIKQLLCWIPDYSQRMSWVSRTPIGCMVWRVTAFVFSNNGEVISKI